MMSGREKVATTIAVLLVVGFTILGILDLTQTHIVEVNAQTLICIEEGHHPLECEKVFK